MDSEHRHELKENDLAEFLAHFGQWWRKYGNTLLTIVLVVVVALTAKRWFENHTAATQDKAWRDLAETTSPDGYRAVAVSYRDPTVRAMAFLRGADQLLAKAAAAAKGHEQTAQATADRVNSDETLSDLDSAAEMYEQVIADTEAHQVFKLNAHLGLAAVAENRRQWDEAQRIYQQVSDLANTRYGAIAERAQARAALLDRLKRRVVFGPDPEPVTPPATFPDVTGLTQPQPITVPTLPETTDDAP